MFRISKSLIFFAFNFCTAKNCYLAHGRNERKPHFCWNWAPTHCREEVVPAADFDEFWGSLCSFGTQSSLLESFRVKTKLLWYRCHQVGSLHWPLWPLWNSLLALYISSYWPKAENKTPLSHFLAAKFCLDHARNSDRSYLMVLLGGIICQKWPQGVLFRHFSSYLCNVQ